MIELLFYFCLPTLTGYDCTYQAYMVDDAMDYWHGKGHVAAMWDGEKRVYIEKWEEYHHEWRHVFCQNHYNYYSENHEYCMDPHFKVMNRGGHTTYRVVVEIDNDTDEIDFRVS